MATIGNSLATRAAPFASALGGGGGTLPASASCPSECFDAARYRAWPEQRARGVHACSPIRETSLTSHPPARAAFLNSKQCVCGRELFRFRDTMARAFDVAVVGVVGAGVAAAALVLLWGTTAAHAARVWQLRCRSSAAAADAAARARDIGDAGGARCDDGDAVVEVAEWPHALVLPAPPGVGSSARRSSAGNGGAASSLPQGPQPWGPHAAYTWSYAMPSPSHHERTRSL